MQAVEVDEGVGVTYALDDGLAVGDKAVSKDEVLVGRTTDGEDVAIERNGVFAANVRVAEAGRIVGRRHRGNRILFG